MGVATALATLAVVLCAGRGVASGTAAPHATIVAPQASQSPAIQSVARIGITVGDLDRAVEFYTRVLGFAVRSEQEDTGDALDRFSGVFGARTRTANLAIGNEEIALTQFVAPEGRPVPIDSRSNDRWFQHIAIVVSDMERAYAHLRAHRVRHVSSGPQTLPDSLPNAAGISAFYFKDPDGHVLEVIHFPPAKGDPRWHTPTVPDQLFLGIDHTAIAVSDTDASVRFYRDVLGMSIAGESENYGPEQEHLNGVFGARLRITTLRAKHGPGVELLEYLAPAGGRPYPNDTQANDLWNWQTILATDAPKVASDRLLAAHARWVSTGTPSAQRDDRSFMVRDPDGHAVVVTVPKQPR